MLDNKLFEDQRERVKEIQLDILKTLHNFCVDNDLKYFLAYGTLLGAIRHKSYIPWDDDVDIWMNRADYNKFCQSFQHSRYEILSPEFTNNYPYHIAKIVDKKSLLVEDGAKETGKNIGVYIDIFVLDNIPDNKFVREIKMYKKYFNYVMFKKNNKATSHSGARFFNIFCKYNAKKTKECTDILTLYFLNKNKRNRRLIWKKEWFDKVVECQFEDMKLFIPCGYDEILKICYNDYMQIPPEDKRVCHRFVKFEEFVD